VSTDPGWQGSHAVRAGVLSVPGRHGLQALAPVAALTRPGGHSWHAVLEFGLWRPAGHLSHRVAPAAPSVSVVEPDGHVRQRGRAAGHIGSERQMRVLEGTNRGWTVPGTEHIARTL
jgi:hypothetical protein